MNVAVDNSVLGHLKRFQATLDRVEIRIDELTACIANLESGQALIKRHLSHLATASAAKQVSIGRINDRLDRIERRLELTS